MPLDPKIVQNISTIFLDLGHTLRITVKDPAYMAQARRRIVELVGTDEEADTFAAKLDERYKAYRTWAFETLIEATESELWTDWLVPDFPAEKISTLSAELTYLYRQSMGRRVVVERAREVVEELCRRGYTLGIISNLIGIHEIQDWLEADGFTPYFKSVVLSSVFGRRKPHPSIYHEAARRAGADPANCVYVGDNPDRDVEGTRRAGFGMMILIVLPEKANPEPIPEACQPDLIIHDFHQLLDVFPDRKDGSAGKE